MEVGVSLPWLYLHSAIYETAIWCSGVLHRSMVDYMREVGVSPPRVYVHSAIYETYLV